MSRITRFAVLVVGLMSLFGIMSASAGAVTWHTTGDPNFTATGGVGTLGVTGINLACSHASATGTAPLGSKVGSVVSLAHGNIVFGGCTLSGIPTGVSCTFTLTSGTATGTTTIDGTADINSCSVTQFGTEVCKIEGQTAGTYHNPVAPSTFGKVSVPASSTLRTTNGAGGSCPLGVGEPSSLTAQTFTITAATGGVTSPHLGPVITRTA